MSQDVIQRRFRAFEEETIDTLKFYDPKLVFKINATQEPLFVLRDIVNRLASLRVEKGVMVG